MEFTPGFLSLLNGSVLLGWLVLLFAPQNKKLVHYVTVIPGLFLSVLYTYLLIKLVTSQKVDFFSLPSWMELMKNPSFVVGTVTHFRIEDLWVARWIVETFYSVDSKYYAQHWFFSKIWVSFILVLTYLAMPCGLILFWISNISLFKQGKDTHSSEFLALVAVGVAVAAQYTTFPPAATLFQWNNFIIFGWIGLIFFPTKKFTKYLVFFPALAVASIYASIILWKMRPLFSASTFNVLALFRLEEWQRVFKDPYMVVTATSHFCVGDLWVGKWMVADYYGKGKEHSLKERIIFGVILFVSYIVNPLGFLLFWLFLALSKPKFPTAQPFNPELDDYRQVYWYEALPKSVLNVFLLIRGILGVLVLFVAFVPGYIVLCLVCLVIGHPSQVPANKPKFPPPFVAYGTAKLRLWLLENRTLKNTILYPLFLLLQFATFVEYIPNSTQPSTLFESLASYFGDEIFPFGDGIGINSRTKSIEWMQPADKNQIVKGPESLGWAVSSSQATFSKYTTILIPDQQKTTDGRSLVHKWLEAYPNQLKDKERFRAQLRVYFPWGGDRLPTEDEVFQAVGNTLFLILSQGGQFTKEELSDYLVCVKNPFIFFPNWFNFLLAGGLLERQGLQGYLSMRNAFARYPDTLKNVFALAEKLSVQKTEALRLLAIVFGLAGAAAPSKVAHATVSKIYEDAKWRASFRTNPNNFVKEIARLDKSVPMVNFFSNKAITLNINGRSVTLPEGTPFHASVVSANIDAKTFAPDPLVFNPDRKTLGDIVVWNGIESQIVDGKQKPPRYCPGHDFSIDVIKEVAELFMPDYDKLQARAENDKKYQESKWFYWSSLDIYTLSALMLMELATKSWNNAPPHGPDIVSPDKLPHEDLESKRNDMNKSIPTWDEDEPGGDSSVRKFARWFVNSPLLPFQDLHKPWRNISEAIGWRQNHFGDLPLPHVYFKDADDLTNRLAFTGLSCHYTRKLDTKEVKEKNLVYVSDISALSLFDVRPGYERYGAAAYFDAKCQIQKIVYQNKTSKPGDVDWNHAKWVYRTSCFAMVTIYDHLLVCHLTESNALVTNVSKFLPQTHALRKFLKPFTYRSVSVNAQAAASLVNSHGLVRRIWGFSHEEFLRVAEWASSAYKFRTLPEFIHPSMRGEDHLNVFPINHDLTEYWNIVRNYVKEWVALYEQDAKTPLLKDLDVIAFNNGLSVQLGIPLIDNYDTLINVYAQLIANGTGVHELVGQVADYVLQPDFVGACLRPGIEIQNVQEYTRMLILSTVTGLKVPRLLDDWSHLCADHIDLYNQFKTQLMDLNLKIVNFNKTRRLPFWSFAPEKLETSVSV